MSCLMISDTDEDETNYLRYHGLRVKHVDMNSVLPKILALEKLTKDHQLDVLTLRRRLVTILVILC